MSTRRYSELGWSPTPVGDIDNPHPDTVSHLKSGFSNTRIAAARIANGLSRLNNVNVMLLSTQGAHNRCYDANRPGIIIGMTAMHASNILRNYSDAFINPSELVDIAKTTDDAATAAAMPNTEQFSNWGARTNAATSTHGSLAASAPMTRPVTHTGIVEAFDGGITVGYIPNDGSGKLYFTRLR